MKNTILTALMLFSLVTQSHFCNATALKNTNCLSRLDVCRAFKGFLRMEESRSIEICNPAAGFEERSFYCVTPVEIKLYEGNSRANLVSGSDSTVPSAFSIGQAYQGGLIAFIDKTGLHGLIVATEDQSVDALWWNGACINVSPSGSDMGTGMENTKAIIAIQGNTGTYAAKICRDYRGGGYTDWYLPSIEELRQVHENKLALGSFVGKRYWSSTQYFNTNAKFWYFDKGYYDYNGKDKPGYVRAVRSF